MGAVLSVKNLGMGDRLSGDYVRGFTAGMQCMQEQILDQLGGIASGKRLTNRLLPGLMEEVIKQRAWLRDFPDYFIRWNVKSEEWELWRNNARTIEQVRAYQKREAKP